MGPNLDPENPDPTEISKAPTRTCRALDWVLGTALLLVAGGLAAHTALGTNPARPPSSEGLSAPPLPSQGPYAQLVIKDVLVKNETLSCHSDPHLSGVFLGSQMTYDTAKRELKVGVPGLYFLYAHLKLHQVMVSAESQGTITVSVSVIRDVGHQTVFTLSLDVGPSSTSTASTYETSLFFLFPGDRLQLSMNTTDGNFLDWQLVSGASTFGLFWVAGGTVLN